MIDTRSYYVHDADTGELVHESVTSYGSSDALDWAEYHARIDGKVYLVSNDQGRNLARFHPDGDMDYLGY